MQRPLYATVQQLPCAAQATLWIIFCSNCCLYNKIISQCTYLKRLIRRYGYFSCAENIQRASRQSCGARARSLVPLCIWMLATRQHINLRSALISLAELNVCHRTSHERNPNELYLFNFVNKSVFYIRTNARRRARAQLHAVVSLSSKAMRVRARDEVVLRI